MQDGVLDATDVLVDRQPVVAALVHRIARTRRGVAGVVPARLHEGVEGVGLALGRAAAVRAGGLAPFQIGLDRRTGTVELHVLRQDHRQLVFRHRHRTALVAVDHRNRAAPVALAAHAPVAQAVIDATLALALALETLGQCLEGALEIQAIELGRIDQLGFARLVAVPILPTGRVVATLVVILRRLQRDDLQLRQVVLGGEFEITLVVARNGHHRAGAVAHQHEIGDPDLHLLAADRMDGAQAGVHAALFLGFQLGFRNAALLHFSQHGGQLRVVLRRVQGQRVFACDGDEAHAHHRVRAGGEHAQRIQRGAVHVAHVELDFQAFGTTNPVALHGLDRIRPARQFIQAVQQLLGVIGDAQEPLRDLALLNQCTGAPTAAVDDLLVGQHGVVHRIPVHHRVAAVSQALAHQAGEHALFVHVVLRRAGGELARPVDRIAHGLELATHVIDVGVGPLGRRGLVLDRRVFSRKAERIPAHRLQHVVAGHALVAADDVADGVVAHMAHMQRTGRVRQHRQAVILGLVRGFSHLESARGLPEFLGGGFNLLGIVDIGFDAGHGNAGQRQSRKGYRSASWHSNPARTCLRREAPGH
ncbi:hypothetical protein D3C81_973990 [compost metagenome]